MVGIGEPRGVRPWTASVEILSGSFHLWPPFDDDLALLIAEEIREDHDD